MGYVWFGFIADKLRTSKFYSFYIVVYPVFSSNHKILTAGLFIPEITTFSEHHFQPFKFLALLGRIM